MQKINHQTLVGNHVVPVEYIGVWQRELLETSSLKDTISLVLWMQTQQYHIDIRIPTTHENLCKVSSLAEYNQDELLLLAAQQGFAGITQVNADVCQWHREVDFQPQTGTRDIGKMVFKDANILIETGLDEPYLEIWRRLENSQNPCIFKFITSKNRHSAETPAYLMQTGNFVAYARPRQVAIPTANSLVDAIERYKPQHELLLDWLDMEISFGEMLDDKHWKIKHSTLPFKENSIVNLVGW